MAAVIRSLNRYEWSAFWHVVPALMIVALAVLILVVAALSDRGLRRREAGMWAAWHKPMVRRSMLPAEKWAQTAAILAELESLDDDRPTPTWNSPASECSEVRSKCSVNEATTVRYTSRQLAQLLAKCA